MIRVIQIDVDSKNSVEAAAKTIANDLGQETLYAIVNNAGVLQGNFDDIMNTNLYGVKLMCVAFLPLIDASVGRIVNVSSEMGSSYVRSLKKEHQKFFKRTEITWE